MRLMDHQTGMIPTSNGSVHSLRHAFLQCITICQGIRVRHLVALILAGLVAPFLLALDVVFFQFTRPTCVGCSSLSEFLTHHSTTIAFIQTNRSLTELTQLFRRPL